jgi:hypothetical protein
MTRSLAGLVGAAARCYAAVAEEIWAVAASL